MIFIQKDKSAMKLQYQINVLRGQFYFQNKIASK